jgi:hypothetical protein
MECSISLFDDRELRKHAAQKRTPHPGKRKNSSHFAQFGGSLQISCPCLGHSPDNLCRKLYERFLVGIWYDHCQWNREVKFAADR